MLGPWRDPVPHGRKFCPWAPEQGKQESADSLWVGRVKQLKWAIKLSCQVCSVTLLAFLQEPGLLDPYACSHFGLKTGNKTTICGALVSALLEDFMIGQSVEEQLVPGPWAVMWRLC